MASTTPLTRSACDRCHAKKVRCVLNRHQSKCEGCLIHNIRCVFSSPGRSGRPPYSSRQTDESSSDSTSSSATAAAGASANSNTQTDLRDGLGSSTISLSQLDNETSALGHGFPQNIECTMDEPYLYTQFESDCEVFGSQHQPPDVIMQEILQNSDLIGLNADQMAASGPGLTTENIGSLTETMRLLHVIQQRLYEERAVMNVSVTTTSIFPGHAAKAPDYGIFFQLIDQMHDILQKWVDNFLSNGATQPCDLTASMSFTTALATVLEVYELVARCGILMLSPSPPPSSSSSSSLSAGSEAVSSSAPATGRHRSSASDVDKPGAVQDLGRRGSQHFMTSSSGSLPTSDSVNNQGRVWVGSFSPSQEISQRILACVLDHQISISQKLFTQARRQFFVQAQGSETLPQSSPQPCYALLQLLEHLQERLAKIKSVALATSKRFQWAWTKLPTRFKVSKRFVGVNTTAHKIT
ncbi:hypothetical protein TSTA_105690 [Talaromyces stipitatus ATCC 10500]|uniref:Zn(2)-C6 fungal-type domain-containing protein n=1 Tax=Talaromyces stipitatus (strain ATCC 10500 / CBS 375.48 / QM 6759 / NRRL 1006) TaxID=441959 RepID=B8MPB9_TALSN|nr:uncharacterized protein TSTA_105690 [Talaromyces stipitatus ATCC 10500]EED14358.1 hypothetical protein TSTA_105690 [Talaromyces stipitatus ATCC 10500]